jgi:hypothetical protein
VTKEERSEQSQVATVAFVFAASITISSIPVFGHREPKTQTNNRPSQRGWTCGLKHLGFWTSG